MKLAGLGTAEHDEDVGYMRPTSPGSIDRDLRGAVRIMTMGTISNLANGQHDVVHASGQGANTSLAQSYAYGLVAPFAVHMYVPLQSCDTKFVPGAT